MATLFLAKLPILPPTPDKKDNPFKSNYSSQSSITEKLLSSQTSIRSDKTSSDSDSTATDHSLSEDSDYDDYVNISSKRVHFSDSSVVNHTQLKTDHHEDEVFSRCTSVDSSRHAKKSKRKRDKIRARFHKKFHRIAKDIPDHDDTEWNKVLVKSLAFMQNDVQEIIEAFDQIEEAVPNDTESNQSETEHLITKPHLTFRERQREKLEMMKISQMLHPPNLLTYDLKVTPYPYTDIVQPSNFNLLRLTKQMPEENLLVQHKPFRHKKFRYRTQRGLLRLRHDMGKMKRDLHGKHPSRKSHQQLPAFQVANYRNRLEKSLIEVRKQIEEYDRLHAAIDPNRESISQIIAKMKDIDPTVKEQIDNYRIKLKTIEHIDKKYHKELNSAPYIPPRVSYRSDKKKNKDKKMNQIIDTRFDPKTFIDLTKESKEYFGPDKPFWDQPPEERLSISLAFAFIPQSIDLIFPTKVGVWDRFVHSYRKKQQKLRSIESEHYQSQNRSQDDNDEFFDCVNPPLVSSTDEVEL